MGREIIAAGLANKQFIENATSGFEAYEACVEKYTLERAERETGIPAEAVRQVAHAYAKAPRAEVCWTLGITEHHNAVDNVLALINLALLTGHVGRYGSGINPLRGQNNVQGGGDMGAIPDRLPGFQHVEFGSSAQNLKRLGAPEFHPKRGLHVSDMLKAMEQGQLTALYVLGENPADSEADRHRALRLLSNLSFLVVQDLFYRGEKRKTAGAKSPKPARTRRHQGPIRAAAKDAAPRLWRWRRRRQYWLSRSPKFLQD